MTRTNNQRSLISQLEGLDVLADRYTCLKCINREENGEKKGVISLIFSAFDTLEEKQVAIKFLDPEFLSDSYRLSVFEREPKILQQLIDKKRCLTIIGQPSVFDWQISYNQVESSIPLKYFATNWLDIDVEKYFVTQDLHEPLLKLKIFKSAVLAVQSIHSEDISHRDLKADNLRGFEEKKDIVCVVIDFGTAAHLDMPKAVDTEHYPHSSVGAMAFSSPEALVGLASCRHIGKFTDIYALGGLLYQLFNPKIFGVELLNNQNYIDALNFLKINLVNLKTFDEKEKYWAENAKIFRYSTVPPDIADNGSTLPKSLVGLIGSLHREMTEFDYNYRIDDLRIVIRKLDNAIKVLENEKYHKYLINKRKILKQRKLKKAKRNEKKLAEYLNRKSSLESRC